jgi:Fur family transcriptional regulator, peroxide stress response regulator
MSSPTAMPRRSTRQRRLVYETVLSTDIHPTAEWVYEAVRRTLPRVSLGTVYRNLQVLVEEGRLKAFIRGGRTCYDGDLEAHDHFSCDRCGLLVDIPRAPEVLSTERRLKARGFTVSGRVLELHGFCRDCRPSHKTAGGQRR